MTDLQPAPGSERVAEAQARSGERLHRQRQSLRPLGWAVILVVVLASANSDPVAGLHGRALAVTLALIGFAAMLLIAIRDAFPERPLAVQGAVIAAIGVAGVAIAGLQLKGATGLAAGVAVFMAITRLPFTAGVAVGGIVTIGLAAVTAIAGSSSSQVAATTLVTVLLGVVAHSLSGAAIQLQGARKLADREHASPVLSDTIDRASELVKSGLANARQAVGALRGDALPTLAELPTLIESYKTDMNLDVTLQIKGQARTLPADPSLALYRGAQEALTNVARYAPGACTTVTVRYEPDRTKLSVDNGVSATAPRQGMGGGRGLEGLRDRIERAGGTISAGPTADGWRVQIEAPA